ncbi:potassium channel family protein [Thermospira aquatica]|uniref:TrkA family potassium uptake protein n=1 Tax=Thermospira aquatica TaxID=2828656 RepID=A0AAX3BFZ2_9SPIR|nr:TrkA family potassium uptake protein [Thermospira aquatica]URA11073.1 TrkA family potassium uptake protein [Thermospira aquatica]
MRDEMMRQDFLIIGVGTFGNHLAQALLTQGVSLLLIDVNEKNLEPFKERENCAVRICDATQEEALRQVIEDSQIEYAVICIGENITASILIALLLKNNNILNIYARANTPEHAAILRLIGVTEIIQPELETAQKWARTLVNQGELVVSYQELSQDYVVVELSATSPLMYRSIEELDLRQKFHLNIVGIRHREESLTENFTPVFSDVLYIPPDPKYMFHEGDRLIVAGKINDINKFKDFLLGKAL